MIAAIPLVEVWVNHLNFEDTLCADDFCEVSKPVPCEKKMLHFQRLFALDGDFLLLRCMVYCAANYHNCAGISSEDKDVFDHNITSIWCIWRSATRAKCSCRAAHKGLLSVQGN